MDAREEFVSLIEKQTLSKGDVIFVLQGDGVARAEYATKLFEEGLAPIVAIVGNANDRAYGSFPSSEVRDKMVERGMKASAIHFEEVAPHTRAEAERAMQFAKQEEWKKILIVTSPHHQYRAFLTFLKAMRDAHLDLVLMNAVAPLSLTEKLPWGTRSDLLERNFDKINEYQKKGDVASYEEGIAYLKKHL
jgi:uncharacterized SAM-binding protein YcdF (DUF218 family)